MNAFFSLHQFCKNNTIQLCIIVQIADAVILQANNTDKIMLAAAVLMQQPVLCHQTLLPSCN